MAVRDDRNVSVAHLIGNLMSDVRRLIRQEIALARAEIREELGQILIAAAVLAVAIATLGLAALWILIAITRGIATVFEWPLSFVYAGVGGALAVLGLVLLVVAWRQVHRLQILPKTRETLRQQADWVSHRFSEPAKA